MKNIKIKNTDIRFIREPLIAPFGFKGKYLTELWQTVVKIESDNFVSATPCTISVLWSDANVFAEDKLFATLDPTSRALELEDGRKILLVDTVGFIRKLPHHLIEAFKSTLEEAVVADVLLHIVDSSNPEYKNQIVVVNEVLRDIGADKNPEIMVYNKCDKADIEEINLTDAVLISAKFKKGLDKLIWTIGEVAPGKKQEITVCIPYSNGSLVSELHNTQKVLSEDYTETGTKLTLLADSITYNKLREYIVG